MRCYERRELERKAAPKRAERRLSGGWDREPREGGQDPELRSGRAMEKGRWGGWSGDVVSD